MEAFGARIRRLRKARGLTREAFAAACGATVNCIEQWETRTTPRTAEIPRVAAVLGVTTDELLMGSEPFVTPRAQREMFAERVRRLRMATGMTQVEFAARLGITKNAVYDWECGYTMPWSRDMPNLARALRVSVDYLLTGKEAAHVQALHVAIKNNRPRDVLLALIGSGPDA